MEFSIPTDIPALSGEELSAAIDGAFAAYNELASIPEADLTDEQADYIVALAEFASAANVEKGNRETAATERAERLSNARAAFASDEDGEEEPAGEEGGEEEEEPVEEPAGEEIPPAPKQTASLKRGSAVRAAKAKQTKQAQPQRPRAAIVAAADVRGVPAGQEYTSLADAAPAILSRMAAMPKSKVANFRSRDSALVIQLPKNEFSQANYLGRESEMLQAVSKESRLPGGSLVAAGGWAAPSDIALDFCEQEDIGNLLQLPEVTVTRGGFQYTKGPTFADVVNSVTGFWDMTEAVAEAGTELKTSIRPAVPGFEEVRLDAVGAMMEAGLLTRAGWPELVERYASLTMTAHAYKMAMKKLRLIEGYTGAAKSVPNGFGNALDVLHILEVVALGERQKYSLAIDATLEVIAPFWVKAAIRADLANRQGIDSLAITDAQIDAYFTARGLRVQWINAYQNLTIDPTSGIAIDYPDTFEVIMYPAGTYVAGVADVITLDTIYDSTNLKKNDYVHLFAEQGLLVANTCGDGVRLTIPLLINGLTAAQNINKNLFEATAP